jgi:hypothetical protein
LEIYETDDGLMLGKTSELVLTVKRSKDAREPSVRFVTSAGDQMNLARDEALRYIRVNYPTWYADDGEISFEDKYDDHDGGSLGAAVGTMVLSVIQGFQIDPDVAMTGDISANGKIRAIGGVSAKIAGAVANKCTVVAIPMENYDQLVDAVVYSGISKVTDIQVIGISNMTDAVAAVRTDRDARLTQAITVFGEIQDSLKKSSSYLDKKEAVAKLTQVLSIAPQHLSAKVLLAMAQGQFPKTLSSTASQYYTFLAARKMLTVLAQRDALGDAHQVPSAVLRSGLADLRKLRPIADPKIRLLVDDWVAFISAWNELQQGEGSSDTLESKRQTLLDEMAKENSDPQLMQKMLKEGM